MSNCYRLRGNGRYILRGHHPIPMEDLLEWGRWMETSDRVVAQTKVGDVRISTVFLGVDHSYEAVKPLLFETMVFEGKLDGEMNRYCTWEEAEKGHQEMVKKVMEAV